MGWSNSTGASCGLCSLVADGLCRDCSMEFSPRQLYVVDGVFALAGRRDCRLFRVHDDCGSLCMVALGQSPPRRFRAVARARGTLL
jgi:hypothetical protein